MGAGNVGHCDFMKTMTSWNIGASCRRTKPFIIIILYIAFCVFDSNRLKPLIPVLFSALCQMALIRYDSLVESLIISHEVDASVIYKRSLDASEEGMPDQ